MKHYVKTLPEFYEASASGLKPFTVRKDDRGYQVGDMLVSREWDGKNYTGRETAFEITYKLSAGQYGLMEGCYVFELKQEPKTNRDRLNRLKDDEFGRFLADKRTFMCNGCYYHYILKELPFMIVWKAI